MDKKDKLKNDRAQIMKHAVQISNNISHLTDPMSGGICKGSDLAVMALEAELEKCRRRITNIDRMLRE